MSGTHAVNTGRTSGAGTGVWHGGRLYRSRRDPAALQSTVDIVMAFIWQVVPVYAPVQMYARSNHRRAGVLISAMLKEGTLSYIISISVLVFS